MALFVLTRGGSDGKVEACAQECTVDDVKAKKEVKEPANDNSFNGYAGTGTTCCRPSAVGARRTIAPRLYRIASSVAHRQREIVIVKQ
jgi:hypothetical protein